MAWSRSASTVVRPRVRRRLAPLVLGAVPLAARAWLPPLDPAEQAWAAMPRVEAVAHRFAVHAGDGREHVALGAEDDVALAGCLGGRGRALAGHVERLEPRAAG